MADPTIICPKCKNEIKLTESLAAPLVEATRQEFEKKLAQKDLDLAAREQALGRRSEALAKERESIEAKVAEKVRQEREKIAADESKKAKQLLSADLEQKSKDISNLQEVLKQRDEKLVEAQNAQMQLLKKQREFEDAKRELELTTEKRMQEGMAAARQQALKDAEEQLKTRVAEKEQTIASMQKQLADLKSQEEAIVAGQRAIQQREEALVKEREAFERNAAEKLQQERARIAEEEARKAKLASANDLSQKAKELSDLQETLKQRDEKLAEAQNAQAEMLKKQREFEDAKRELELTVEKRVQENLTATRQQAKKEAEDELKQKVSEKEQVIAGMQRQIEDLKRRAEQGSQQLQGEVQEIELETLLKTKFPRDTIDPVPKGEFGGDVLHRVMGPFGQICGTILWESKRTKNWTDGWLSKLRDDQRAAKAEIAIIVSQALPKGIEGFGFVDGVWVTHTSMAIPVSVALRHGLIETFMARQASVGQQTKMEMVYQYLTGQEFRQRVQAIAEAFNSMKKDLDAERTAIQKQWAKREKQISRVIEATVGMYGDLQGIAGRSLQEIDGLEFKALDDSKEVGI
jgi:hypothetical protein